MNEQLGKLLQQLAEKLGTTVEHLWGVLVKQASITATIDLIYSMFLIFILISTALYAPRTVQKIKEITEDSFGDSFCAYMTAVIGGIAWIVLLIFILDWFGNFSMIMAGFMNPEYWALTTLLKMIK
jgi:hypothetical protein